ncbi:MAG: hypothetical protein LM588_03070 [Fervidicoccaceae archaeon]|nr:hypothetical protein [Fervidicoccaceae archaeon]
MPRLRVEGDRLVIELGRLESILSLKRRLEIPLSCIEKAAYVWSLNEDEKKQISPRMRIAGAYLGKAIYGHYLTKMGRAFFVARKYPEKSIALYLKGCLPYKIVVIDAEDPRILTLLMEKIRR